MRVIIILMILNTLFYKIDCKIIINTKKKKKPSFKSRVQKNQMEFIYLIEIMIFFLASSFLKKEFEKIIIPVLFSSSQIISLYDFTWILFIPLTSLIFFKLYIKKNVLIYSCFISFMIFSYIISIDIADSNLKNLIDLNFFFNKFLFKKETARILLVIAIFTSLICSIVAIFYLGTKKFKIFAIIFLICNAIQLLLYLTIQIQRLINYLFNIKIKEIIIPFVEKDKQEE